MKVAISLPDPLYKRADREARRRKLTRSGLVAEALVEYFRGRDGGEITRRLNEAADEFNREHDAGLQRLAIEALRKSEW